MISSSFEEQEEGEEEIPQRCSKCYIGKAKQMLPETAFASPNLRNTVTAPHPYLSVPRKNIGTSYINLLLPGFMSRDLHLRHERRGKKSRKEGDGTDGDTG